MMRMNLSVVGLDLGEQAVFRRDMIAGRRHDGEFRRRWFKDTDVGPERSLVAFLCFNRDTLLHAGNQIFGKASVQGIAGT